MNVLETHVAPMTDAVRLGSLCWSFLCSIKKLAPLPSKIIPATRYVLVLDDVLAAYYTYNLIL